MRRAAAAFSNHSGGWGKTLDFGLAPASYLAALHNLFGDICNSELIAEPKFPDFTSCLQNRW
jgi:hypothetical protein